MKLARTVCVLGVGMTKFHKPGTMDYPQLTKEAGEDALRDAGVSYRDVEQAFVGYVYGDSTCGQRAVYHSGSPASRCSTSTTTARPDRPR